MENKKIYRLSKFISIYSVIMVLFQILIYFNFEFIIDILNISFPLLLSIISPVYFFILYFNMYKTRKIKLNIYKSLKYILVVILFDFVISFFMIDFVDMFFETNINLNIVEFENADIVFKDIILILLWDLLGEEGLKLGLYTFLDKIFLYDNLDIKTKEKRYIYIWIIISLIFGLLHLTAYEFNLLQCILVIGLPNIIYGWLWKKTKNPLALWIAHVAYDAVSLYLILKI